MGDKKHAIHEADDLEPVTEQPAEVPGTPAQAAKRRWLLEAAEARANGEGAHNDSHPGGVVRAAMVGCLVMGLAWASLYVIIFRR